MKSDFKDLNELKVLCTGPRGFIGARIMHELPNAIPSPSLRTFSESSVARLTDGVDLIIHTAAMSDVQTCEKHPAEAYHANVELPVLLAGTGARLIVFSSGQVYSGCSAEGPYREEDAHPATLYGRQKWEMEQRVLDINPDAVMLRATWMYDMPVYGFSNRGNFLVDMLRKQELSFSSSQHWAVTYAREAAGNIRKAAELPGGAYNYGSESDLYMLDAAQWLKDRLQLSVKLHDTGPLHNLWMDCTKIRNHGIYFSSMIDGLERCIRDYGL
ncbi:MAG: sugar nucleotide-binding protein [Oscillospiraceae bacterium]|nr:sugar nucleotide-binding protein [Oscillospiraceae bacterium]